MLSSQKMMSAPSGGEAAYIDDVFSTYLYTGNSSTQNINNGIDLDVGDGLVWIKKRTTVSPDTFNNVSHYLFDTLRGANFALTTNNTAAQTSGWSPTYFNFSSTGFQVGNLHEFNRSASLYSSWTFSKQPKFFDVVTYTGNGVAGRAISHSLGSTPGCIIVKILNATGGWRTYHRSVNGGTTPENYGLQMNGSTGQFLDSTFWNNTAPTSTEFTVGTNATVNASGATYVAYLFAHDAGGFGAAGTDNVISCGGYTGNGSTTGTAVTLGWEPQWLLIKRINSQGDWNLIDNMRGFVVGGADKELNPNSSVAESTGTFVTPTATGFQLNTTDAGYNASGGAYIYIAIRRPMKPPTTGTEVFAPLALNNSTGTTNTTGFPVDLQISAERNSSHATPVNDRLRGVVTTPADETSPYLRTDSTAAEQPETITRYWTNTGFQTSLYSSGVSSVYWNFRRAPGFFDVVCYTGTGSATTVAHNLGVAPEMMIVKKRDSTTPRNWSVYNSALGANGFIYLDLTNGSQSDAAVDKYWDSTAPTSSVFSVGTQSRTNASGANFVAYLFASCPGVSKVGSYTGTGTTNSINCGFTGGARFVMIKRTDSSGAWYVWDSARGIVSGDDPYLLINSDAAEVTNTDYIDPLSSGFQISSTAPSAINASGGTFIYLAIA
jgi:hypothetical protein